MKSKRHTNFNFLVMTLAYAKGIFDVWSQFGFQNPALWLIALAVGIFTVLLVINSAELLGSAASALFVHITFGLWIFQGGLYVVRIGSFGKPNPVAELLLHLRGAYKESIFGLVTIDLKTLSLKLTALKRTAFPSLALVFNRRQGAYALHPLTQSLLFFG